MREGLRTGRFAPSDLGWREGMQNWQPLSQFAEFAAETGGAGKFVGKIRVVSLFPFQPVTLRHDLINERLGSVSRENFLGDGPGVLGIDVDRRGGERVQHDRGVAQSLTVRRGGFTGARG